jgi:hypothetical protein
MALTAYSEKEDEEQPAEAEAMRPHLKCRVTWYPLEQAGMQADEYPNRRSAVMAQLQIVYLPRAGTQERWRRLWQDIGELRSEQFASTCQQLGITRVQVRLLHLLHGELLLVSMQTQEPQQTLQALASAASPFARWLGEQARALLGWNMQEVLAGPPADLLFTWES